LLATALVFGTVLQGAVAEESILSARDVYLKAVSAMRTIPRPAYLTFDAEGSQTHKNQVMSYGGPAIERTRDNMYRAVTRDHGIQVGRNAIPPDLFLKLSPVDDGSFAPVLDAPPTIAPGGEELHVIGSTTVMTLKYDVTIAGREDVSECAGAYHLVLVPRLAPSTNNMRDLWVDPTSFRICRANGIFRGSLNAGGKTIVSKPIVIRLDVNSDGFVTHYNTIASFHFIIGGYSSNTEEYYRNVRVAEKVDDGIFQH